MSITAIFAVSAAAASAAQWHVGGSTLTGSASYTGKATGALTFSSEVGGNPYSLTASGVEMLESSITNEDLRGPGRGTTRLRFTGVTVSGFGGCVVPGGTITTVALKTAVESAGGPTYDVFSPASGSGLFTWSLAKGSSPCPLAGTYVMNGEFAAPVGSLATEAVTHEFSFSKTADEAFYKEFHHEATPYRAAKMWSNLGPAPVILTGSISESLTGSYLGQTWSAS